MAPAEPAVMPPDLVRWKQQGRKISVLTAYDFTTARLLDEAGVDCLLVGDTLGMVVQGHETSLGVTLEEVIYHTRLVARGVRRSLLVADLPFMTFQVGPQQALENAGRLVKEGGAHAVKLEGGVRSAAAIAAITRCDIPVMGHVGMTPQSVHTFGGFKVQRDATRILDDALAMEAAGCWAVLMEAVPASLAGLITRKLKVPTIGIGAGPYCDGQVQVIHDFLGIFQDFVPRHAKQYAQVGATIRDAVTAYVADVRAGSFPTAKESFGMKQEAPAELQAELVPYGGR